MIISKYHCRYVLQLGGVMSGVFPTSSYSVSAAFFHVSGGKQWNNQPDEIRTSESLSIFRNSLQKLQLSSSHDCMQLYVL